MGLAFAHTEENHYEVAFGGRQVVISEVSADHRRRTWEKGTIDAVALSMWHRLSVSVEKTRIEAWFDGKRVAQTTAADREDLRGRVGLLYAGCKAEYREIRMGRPD